MSESGALHAETVPLADSRANVQQIETALEKGCTWLCFPASLEKEFRRETQPGRLYRSVVCALIALLGFGWITITNLSFAIVVYPALAIAHLGVVLLILASIALGLVCRHPERIWPQEQMATVAVLASTSVILWNGITQGTLISLTHTAALLVSLSFANVIVRQRFWYALLTTGTSLALFFLLVTPQQADAQLVFMHISLLLGIASMLTLCANYRYELRSRRSFLFTRLESLHQAQLARTNTQLETLARTDALTGIGNRRGFDRHLATAWRRAILARDSVALLLVDLDYFKHYNDTYGHPQGDCCLREVGQVIADVALQHGASAYRVGGEEFAIILAHGTPTSTETLAETVRESIRDLSLPHENSEIADHMTASIGAATCQPFHRYVGTTATLQKRADVALYRAKSAGRNRVACTSEREALDDRPLSASAPVDTTELARPRPRDVVDVALLDALDANDRPARRFLRFAPALENLYRQERDAFRSRTIVLYTLAGLGVYNACFFFSRMLIHDIPEMALRWQYCVSLLILAIIAMGVTPMRAWLRETLHTTGIGAVAVGTLFVSSLSNMPTASTLATAAFLIPFFSVVAGGLSFRSAIAMVLAVLVGFMALIHPATPDQALIIRDYRSLMTLVSLFTLAAAYQLEYGARLGFAQRLATRLRRTHLEAASRQLLSLSTSDPLTGIGNRRRFDLELPQIWGRACVAGQRTGLLVLDIDDFKQYNDVYGHGSGDSCLRRVATAINQTAMELEAEAFRIGGEEFALLLPDAGPHAVRAAAARVHRAVSGLNILHSGSRSADIVTVSIGAASLAAQGNSRETDLVAAADRALYTAKAHGRNRYELDDASVA